MASFPYNALQAKPIKPLLLSILESLQKYYHQSRRFPEDGATSQLSIVKCNMASCSTLVNLPPEILLIISESLPSDAILALKLTHPRFNDYLLLASHSKHNRASPCSRLAINTYSSTPTSTDVQIRCILCKTIYPASMFHSANSPACLPPTTPPNTTTTPIEVVELPHRLCSWHVGRLARIIQTGPSGRNEWICQTVEMCMHCGAVQSWNKCGCECDSCWYRTVKAYTRYLNNEWQCKEFRFWRKMSCGRGLGGEDVEESELWVREVCWDLEDEGRKVVVDVAVWREGSGNSVEYA